MNWYKLSHLTKYYKICNALQKEVGGAKRFPRNEYFYMM